jgi:hypothetical protein
VNRLAGLLPSLQPEPHALKAWVAAHRPGTILVANVMGQFGVVAERVVEAAFGWVPWEVDPERSDPLAEALEAWTRRAIMAFLGILRDSGADLWLVHDRAVVFSGDPPELGPWEDPWPRQLRSEVEASDALAGLEVPAVLLGEGTDLVRKERWIWPLANGQTHLVEALAFRRQDSLWPASTLVPASDGQGHNDPS